MRICILGLITVTNSTSSLFVQFASPNNNKCLKTEKIEGSPYSAALEKTLCSSMVSSAVSGSLLIWDEITDTGAGMLAGKLG